MSVRVVAADSPELLTTLAGLLTRYAHEQGWAHEQYHLDEVAALPGEYGPPAGRTLVALDANGEPLGCALLRPIPQWCVGCLEMRRLYVVPTARRRGVGTALIRAAETHARETGHTSLRLVTLPSMPVAQRLYERLGFVHIAAYRPSTAEAPVYMEKRLGSEASEALG